LNPSFEFWSPVVSAHVSSFTMTFVIIITHGIFVIISSMGLFELQSWLPARALVQEALEGRHKVDPSGQIIKLPVAGCPWKEHLAQLEEEQKLGDAIKFCLYEVS